MMISKMKLLTTSYFASVLALSYSCDRDSSKSNGVVLPNRTNETAPVENPSDSETKETSQATQIELIELSEQLPACDSTNQGKIVYISQLQQIQICTGQTWSIIKGEKGETGSTGEAGAAGLDGIAGVKGERGDKGETGAVGQTGSKGDNGKDATPAPVDPLANIWRDIAKNNTAAIVKIVSLYSNDVGDDFAVSKGTGFVVANGIVATNGHVVNYTMKIENEVMYLIGISVVYPGSTESPSADDTIRHVQGMDMRMADSDDEANHHDLALLTVDTLGRKPLELSQRDDSTDMIDVKSGVALQEAVFTIGHAGGVDHQYMASGRILAIQDVENTAFSSILGSDNTVYITDFENGGGGSGSPVFDISGQVIGIYFAGNSIYADTNYEALIQVTHLRELLATHSESTVEEAPAIYFAL